MDVISQLSFSDIQHIIAGKFFLFLFIIFGVITIWKKLPLWIFLLGTGMLAAGAYLVLVNDLQLMFSGLNGDEITIAAMYEMFAQHSFLSDFAYVDLPPFYPPLFFWFFAFIGRLFNWHGVLIAKFASAVSIAIFPIGVYIAQHYAFRFLKKGSNGPKKLAFFLAPLLCFIVIGWDAIILKPYELITAAATVIWATSLFCRLWKKQWSWKIMLVYAFFGGLIFLTYYLWLIFAAIGLSIGMLWVRREEQWRFYGQFALIIVLSLLLASPYLVPLVRSYRFFGTENWQTILMTLKGISLHAPFFGAVTWQSIIMLMGVVSLVVLRKHMYGRLLILLFLSSYIWQAMGLTTIFFFDTPLQEFKGFYFFNRVILAFALAYGIQRASELLPDAKKYSATIKTSAAYIGVLFLGSQMIFGFFLDDPAVQLVRVRSKSMTVAFTELITFLREDQKNDSSLPKTLHSGIGEIHAFVPLNMYLYLNQHNTHPAAHFFTRLEELRWMLAAPDAEEFRKRIDETTYGPIERFIFFKEPQKTTYDISVFMDNFPHGARVDILEAKKDFFVSPYVDVVFENDKYVVFDVVQ